MATIALDFDDTFTADRELWTAFIVNAQSRGHRVICVTARRDTPENREIVVVGNDVPVYFTGLTAKRWYVETKWGTKVDIWIDDKPEVILNGF